MIEDTAFASGPDSGGIGAQLRAEREAQALTLEQVSAETRIPMRHLQTIESGDFASLPGRSYATGFARTYAKLLGLAPEFVVDQVRAEMAAQPQDEDDGERFEPGDPARIPSAGLSWLALAAVLLLLLGGFFFMRTLFTPAAQLPSLVEQQEQEDAARQAQAQAQREASAQAEEPAGPVMFTALEEGIWVKFYDASGRQLMQKQMALGERYTVPADAEGPQLWTGRPDALEITIGGQPVPRLAERQSIMRDVPVTAEALLARQGQAAQPAQAQSPTA
jgi:transcriptional regulator with XRE-family HTH domain